MKYTVGIYLALADMDTRRTLPTRPFSDDHLKDKYDRLHETAKQHDMEIVVVLEHSYVKDRTFSTFWKKTGSDWTEMHEAIQLDLVFVKSVHLAETLEESMPLATHREVERINDDKYYMYTVFSDLMAFCTPISEVNWDEAMASIRTEKVVLKPRDGSCGDGIIIGNKSEVSPTDLDPQYEYLVQEFIDGSKGIPGIVSGYHDLRVIVHNGRPQLVAVRKAPADSLMANVALGASLEVLDFNQVPESILALIQEVDNKLSRYFPRIYTIDIMFDQGEKPYLVEINTAPGFPSPEVHGHEYINSFNTYLVESFIEAIEKEPQK